ncbi:hypothetical protein [Pararhizobium sp. IMCC21322]|uniref:hypothetical protein n=1 Tax=Pararhizobium sp. IMCC21322 TaxID=3067903 RepID=UPI0027427DB9|nr:hypothetical protein [Pararhizobium sp. IMCC21322]
MTRNVTDYAEENPFSETGDNGGNFALPNKPGIGFNTLSLAALGIFQFSLLWNAMSKILGDTTPLSLFLSLIISLIAVVCAYTINHLAITRGTVLSVLNFKGVQFLSIVGIVAIGFAISSATITGNVQDTVGEIQLQEHHASMAATAAAKNEVAIQATQTVPVLSAITSDLPAHAESERVSASLSESGQPGTGPVTRLLIEKSTRAQNISDILADGEITRKESLERMNKLLGEYQSTLDSQELSFREKRSVLQKNHAQIVAEGAILDNAIPKSLLLAYANELQGSVELQGHPIATRNVDAVLNGHGKALQRVLETIEGKADQSAPFPSRPSLADVLSYIAYYWPFAAVVYGAEIGLPLMLFVITYARLYHVYITENGINPTVKRRDDVDEFREQLLALRQTPHRPIPVATSPKNTPTSRKPGRPRKDHGNGLSPDGMAE